MPWWITLILIAELLDLIASLVMLFTGQANLVP